MKSQEPKLFRIKYGIVGIAGDLCRAQAFVRWLRDTRLGSEPDRAVKPCMRDVEAILLTPAGITEYNESCDPTACTAPFTAIGSGEQSARTSMLLGQDPKAAVRLAKEVDINTGGRIRTLALRPKDFEQWQK